MSDKKHAYRDRLENAYKEHKELIRLRKDGKTSKAVLDTIDSRIRSKIDNLPEHYKIMAKEQTA